MEVGLYHFLAISAILFACGLFTVITKKNVIAVLMGVELILNSANINFVAFSRYSAINMDGQIFALFVIILAAAEAAVALAIVLNLFYLKNTVDLDEVQTLSQ